MAITYEGVAKQTRQIIHHHAVLRRGLERRVGTLCEAVESGVPFQRQMSDTAGIHYRRDPAPCRGGGTHPLPRCGYPRPRQRAGPRPDCRAPRAGISRRAAAARRGRHRGRHRLGMDRDAVRRARGQGERPAAARAHRLRRGPGRPARGHARAAIAEARISPVARLSAAWWRACHRHRPRRRGDHHVPGLGAFSGAARHHRGGRRRLAGGMAHRGVPRRPATTRHIRGRERRTA